nr:class I SAM-dependent methyltransferase [Thiocapsa sp. KS1]
MSLPLDQADCVDIGCGGGAIAFHIAPLFHSIIGVDLESWVCWSDFQTQRNHLCVSQYLGGESIDFSCGGRSYSVYAHLSIED